MMIAEIYEALVEAGTSEEKAKAAAGVVPVIMWMTSLHLATIALIVTLVILL